MQLSVQILKAKMYQRRDTTANWIKFNPVLASGEFGYDTDKKKYKIGDGVTHWNDLQFSYIGEITDKNGDILRYKDIATEEFVSEEINSSIVFKSTKLEFPSIGKSNAIYVELESNYVFIWNTQTMLYEPIGTNVTLPEEELKPLISDAVNIILADKLKEDIPAMIDETINNRVLDCGDSVLEESN